MKLETLEENWKVNFNSDAETALWDNVADEWAVKPVPKIENDYFLRFLDKKGLINKENSFLDIGCAAGSYTLALAPYVKSSSGCDLSPNMVEAAKKRAEDMGYDNTDFKAVDWYNDDIEPLGYEKNFDVVFARMTPAVNDYESMEKMIRCCRKYGILQKNSNRTDKVLDEALRMCGMDNRKSGAGEDNIVPETFAYLWLNGYYPEIDYHKSVSNIDRTVEATMKWCMSRIIAKKEMTESEEKAVKDYLNGISENGMIREVITNTVVTIFWNMEK